MNNPFKKLDLITLVAVFIFAAALSLMNFKDLSWETNYKSYLGFAVFLVYLIFRAIQAKNKPTNVQD